MGTSEYIFLTGIIIGVVACVSVNCFCGKYPIDANEPKETQNAIKARNIWIRSSVTWLTLYYWTILNSILSTLLVLYISCYETMDDTNRAKVFVYSSVSLFSSICPYILNMIEMSKAYRAAFGILDAAIASKGNIIDAKKEGEKIILEVHR